MARCQGAKVCYLGKNIPTDIRKQIKGIQPDLLYELNVRPHDYESEEDYIPGSQGTCPFCFGEIYSNFGSSVREAISYSRSEKPVIHVTLSLPKD